MSDSDGVLDVFQASVLFRRKEKKVCSAAGFTEKLPLEEKKTTLNCLLLGKKQFLVAAVESDCLCSTSLTRYKQF